MVNCINKRPITYGNYINFLKQMEINEIKQRLTQAEVLKHYGLKPDKSLRLHCPFHEDKAPSL